MARLSLAFLLTLTLHVLLFFVVLPGQGDTLPQIRGIRQVTVRLSHPVPEKVNEVREVPSAAPERVVAKITEPEPEKKTIAPPPPRVQQEKRKIVAPPEIIREKKQTNEPAERIDTDNREEKKKLQVSETIDTTDRPAGQQSDAAMVQQAVPIYQSNQPPEYPNLARRRGWEGTTLLEVDVSEDGQVTSVRIQAASPYDLLNNAALDAVKRWQFQPGTKGGKPVAMKVLVPVHFVLKDMP